MEDSVRIFEIKPPNFASLVRVVEYRFYLIMCPHRGETWQIRCSRDMGATQTAVFVREEEFRVVSVRVRIFLKLQTTAQSGPAPVCVCVCVCIY